MRTQRLTKRTNRRKGFTLVELVIVIVIIGILAALVIPNFQTLVERFRGQSLATTAKSIDREAMGLAAEASEYGAAHRTNDVVHANVDEARNTAGDTYFEWASEDVSKVVDGVITVEHPLVGDLTRYELTDTDSGQKVCYTPGASAEAGVVAKGACTA